MKFKMPNIQKLKWLDIRDKQSSWNHVQVFLSGDKDKCRCILCQVEFDLEIAGRSRESILREVARTHFYKHRLHIVEVEPCQQIISSAPQQAQMF